MNELIKKDYMAQGAILGKQEMLEFVLDIASRYSDHMDDDSYREMIKDFKDLV